MDKPIRKSEGKELDNDTWQQNTMYNQACDEWEAFICKLIVPDGSITNIDEAIDFMKDYYHAYKVLCRLPDDYVSKAEIQKIINGLCDKCKDKVNE